VPSATAAEQVAQLVRLTEGRQSCMAGRSVADRDGAALLRREEHHIAALPERDRADVIAQVRLEESSPAGSTAHARARDREELGLRGRDRLQRTQQLEVRGRR